MSRITRETPALKRYSWRVLLLDNLAWLMGSFMLAVIVWYAAVATQNPVDQRRIGQRISVDITLDPQYIVVKRTPETVQVTIRALQSVLNDLNAASDVEVTADLSGFQMPNNAESTRRVVNLQGRLLNGLRGAVVDISPKQIEVEIAPRGERLIDINVFAAQEPPVGYVAVITPLRTQVLISGSKALIERVNEVRAPLSLQNQTNSFTRSVDLTPVDAEGNVIAGVTLDPPEVTVNVDIQQRSDVTGLQIVPNYVGQLPEGYVLKSDNWEPRRVFVRGDPDIINRMNGTVNTEPIDLSDRTQTFTQVVRLDLPNGVTLPDPTDVTVTITIEPVLTTREFTNIPIQPQGLDPADYAIVLAPDQVTVEVTGPQKVIEKLQPSDISVFAPLANLGEGTHTVTLQASVAASGISTDQIVIQREQIEVTITSKTSTVAPTARP